MKTYRILLATGEMLNIQGMMLQRDEVTGQITIYSTNNPTYIYIVAIIPPTAAVLIKQSQE